MPLLERLHAALQPTWHEARIAGRVQRHTEMLRDIAHELSTSSEREDRPGSAQEAQRRFEAHLDELAANAPRAGLGAATGHFIDDLVGRYIRYGEHLFHCFEDTRIPATTNELEGFFGAAKRFVREAGGCGSTTNSVVTNLGANVLRAFHKVQQPGAIRRLARAEVTQEEFMRARARLAEVEAPATRQRSMVRSLRRRLAELRESWIHGRVPDG